MNDPISIIIVDDHDVVRQGLRGYLETQPDFTVIGEADSGETALELVSELVPDIILMDLLMPQMDGVEATRCVKKISPRTQIVVLSSYHQDEYIFPALKAGAISYLLKDVKMEDLAIAVRQAAHGETSLHPRVAARVVQEIQGSKETPFNPFTELTDREFEVLKLIANGLSNKQIAERIVISENTVRGYVSNILSKLQLADRTQAAVYAWREGIMRPKE
jgi:DNA-binding NarL/FixJ family response regulator